MGDNIHLFRSALSLATSPPELIGRKSDAGAKFYRDRRQLDCKTKLVTMGAEVRQSTSCNEFQLQKPERTGDILSSSSVSPKMCTDKSPSPVQRAIGEQEAPQQQQQHQQHLQISLNEKISQHASSNNFGSMEATSIQMNGSPTSVDCSQTNPLAENNNVTKPSGSGNNRFTSFFVTDILGPSSSPSSDKPHVNELKDYNDKQNFLTKYSSFVDIRTTLDGVANRSRDFPFSE